MARTSTTGTPRRGGKIKTYSGTAGAAAYSPGEVLHFEEVRLWRDKGNLVEAYGKVLSVEKFDNEVPYIVVSFNDPEVDELNEYDLGNWPRNFLVDIQA
jgi:hypothetical protein